MLKTTMAAAAVATALGLAGQAAAAVTIDFNDVDPNPCCVLATSYVSQDMIFTSAGVTDQLRFPPDSGANIDPGGASVVGDNLVMRVDGGGTFDLLGFTFGVRSEDDFGATPAGGHLDVRFIYNDGRDEVESFDVTRFGPEAVTLQRLDLRRVEFLRGLITYDMTTCSFCTSTGSSQAAFTFDDIVIDNVGFSPDPGGPVPEPSTWAMLIAGFGIAGASLRRRRQRMPYLAS